MIYDMLLFFFNALQEAIDSAFIPTEPLTKHAKLDHSAVVEASSPSCVSVCHILMLNGCSREGK